MQISTSFPARNQPRVRSRHVYIMLRKATIKCAAPVCVCVCVCAPAQFVIYCNARAAAVAAPTPFLHHPWRPLDLIKQRLVQVRRYQLVGPLQA